jgi:hypothetical protein
VDLTNPANLVPFMAKLQAVAMETKCFGTGDGWHGVIPSQMHTALYSSTLADKFNLGACSELVCGLLNGQQINGQKGPFGFRWWLNMSMSQPNAAGAVPIVIFHESAQIFASDVVVNRVYEGQQFDRFYQMLLVSGGKVIHPERVVVAWVRF